MALGIWYGADPVWSLPLQREARRRFGSDLKITASADSLTYELCDLDVPGDDAVYCLSVAFYREPPYDTYGLQPEDYPAIRVLPNRKFLHQFEDGRLCVWMPRDPPDRRWTSDLGLNTLIEIVRRHLQLELHLRHSGGSGRGEWILEDGHG